MKTKRKWKMPKWMIPFSEYIVGNDIEEMMDDTTAYQINGPRALVALSIKSQVSMLERLHRAGVLD